MSDYRYNALTGQFIPEDVVDETHVVEFQSEWNGRGIKLVNGAALTAPRSVVIVDADTGDPFTEQTARQAPNAGQFWVDYDADGYTGTSQVHFNAADVGKNVLVSYKSVGAIARASWVPDSVSALIASSSRSFRESIFSNWQTPAFIDNDWTGIAFGGGVWVAVGATGPDNVMISFDGHNWSAGPGSDPGPWAGIAYGGGIFVAVGDGGVMASPGGVGWNSGTPVSAGPWNAVGYGGGLFVATSSLAEIMTSPDGITWTLRANPSGSSFQSVAYGAGQFVVVGVGGVMTSPDGINWTVRTPASSNPWSGVTYGDGQFVAVATSGLGSGQVMTSPDGILWTARNASALARWSSVSWGGGVFAAVAAGPYANEDKIMISADGINWRPVQASERAVWTGVAFGQGRFVSISLSGGFVGISLAYAEGA